MTQPSPFGSQLGTNYVPTDDELTTLSAFLAGPRADLAALTSKAAELRLSLAALEAEQEGLSAYIDAHTALRSPMRRLPDDLVREIFLACLPDKRNSAMSAGDAPLLLGRVSSAWRALALTTPRLWTRLHVVHPVGDRVIHGRLDAYGRLPDSAAQEKILRQQVEAKLRQRVLGLHEFLGRSGDCPLHLSLDVPQSSRQSPGTLVEELVRYAHRWRTIDFKLTAEGLTRLLQLTEEDVPLLRTVRLNPQMTEASHQALMLTGAGGVNAGWNVPGALPPGLHGVAAVHPMVPHNVGAAALAHVPAPNLPFPPAGGPPFNALTIAAMNHHQMHQHALWQPPAETFSYNDWPKLRLVNGPQVTAFTITVDGLILQSMPFRWAQLTTLSVTTQILGQSRSMLDMTPPILRAYDGSTVLKMLAHCTQLRTLKMLIVDHTLSQEDVMPEVTLEHLSFLDLVITNISPHVAPQVEHPLRLFSLLRTPKLKSFVVQLPSDQLAGPTPRAIPASLLDFLGRCTRLDGFDLRVGTLNRDRVRAVVYALPASLRKLSFVEDNRTGRFGLTGIYHTGVQHNPGNQWPRDLLTWLTLPRDSEEASSSSSSSLSPPLLPAIEVIDLKSVTLSPSPDDVEAFVVSRPALTRLSGRFGEPVTEYLPGRPEICARLSGGLVLALEYATDQVDARYIRNDDSVWRGLCDGSGDGAAQGPAVRS
ncbi:unnamed protein product [Mycena citricolor]|uniref:F-box domain-containing protein n=1 Tax=Mycena citricolor TaxID=2018698 RepID=A0AAD2K8E4_9AGAR|nr:unnamed protein product [Mycena citricolor]